MARNKYTKELLEPIIKKSITWASVCRKVGITPMTGAQSHLKKVAIKFEIDFSHFVGKAFNKGRRFGYKRPIEDYFSGKYRIGSHILKKRLFAEKLKEKRCEECGTTEWMGEECVFELDHINNNPEDNRLKNLKIYCPNCHAIKTRQDRRQAKITRNHNNKI